MTAQPAIRLGDYGDGTIGLKTSLPGYDVTVRADDDDVTKRSFNSEWTSLMKVRAYGVVASTPVAYQYHLSNAWYNGASWNTFQEWVEGWYWQLPFVPLPFDYIPHWEERCYDATTKTFFDDDANPVTNYTGYPYYNTWTGGRSWITMQATSNDTKNNTNYTPSGEYATSVQYPSAPVTPQYYPAKCLVFDPNFRSSAAPTTPMRNRNWIDNQGTPGQTGSGWPGLPSTPVSGRAAYVMFGSKLGDWS